MQAEIGRTISNLSGRSRPIPANLVLPSLSNRRTGIIRLQAWTHSSARGRSFVSDVYVTGACATDVYASDVCATVSSSMPSVSLLRERQAERCALSLGGWTAMQASKTLRAGASETREHNHCSASAKAWPAPREMLVKAPSSKRAFWESCQLPLKLILRASLSTRQHTACVPTPIFFFPITGRENTQPERYLL